MQKHTKDGRRPLTTCFIRKVNGMSVKNDIVLKVQFFVYFVLDKTECLNCVCVFSETNA